MESSLSPCKHLFSSEVDKQCSCKCHAKMKRYTVSKFLQISLERSQTCLTCFCSCKIQQIQWLDIIYLNVYLFFLSSPHMCIISQRLFKELIRWNWSRIKQHLHKMCLICSSPSSIPSNGEDEDQTTGRHQLHILYVLYVSYRKPDFICSFIILIKTELAI